MTVNFGTFGTFQKTLASGNFLDFDFSGITEGSRIHWPSFPLPLLPWPEGIEVPEGTVDFTWDYEPVCGITRVRLENINARFFVPSIFGEYPASLRGNVDLNLFKGGKGMIEFREFSISIPSLKLAQVAQLRG